MIWAKGGPQVGGDVLAFPVHPVLEFGATQRVSGGEVLERSDARICATAYQRFVDRDATEHSKIYRCRAKVLASGIFSQFLGRVASRHSESGQELVGDLDGGVERGLLGREEVPVCITEHRGNRSRIKVPKELQPAHLCISSRWSLHR